MAPCNHIAQSVSLSIGWPSVNSILIVFFAVFNSQCPYTKVKALPAADVAAVVVEPLRLSSAYSLNFKIFDLDQGHYAYDNV